MARGLDQVLAAAVAPGVKILLETTAGQGSGLGSRFEELAVLFERCSFPERLGVCLDTCHVFTAGYDLSSAVGVDETLVAFDRVLGLERLELIHLNDSKRELASRVDRHEHIGKGAIGLAGFARLVNDTRLARVPMVLETPKDKTLEQDRANLKVLRGLIDGAGT